VAPKARTLDILDPIDSGCTGLKRRIVRACISTRPRIAGPTSGPGTAPGDAKSNVSGRRGVLLRISDDRTRRCLNNAWRIRRTTHGTERGLKRHRWARRAPACVRERERERGAILRPLLTNRLSYLNNAARYPAPTDPVAGIVGAPRCPFSVSLSLSFSLSSRSHCRPPRDRSPGSTRRPRSMLNPNLMLC